MLLYITDVIQLSFLPMKRRQNDHAQLRRSSRSCSSFSWDCGDDRDDPPWRVVVNINFNKLITVKLTSIKVKTVKIHPKTDGHQEKSSVDSIFSIEMWTVLGALRFWPLKNDPLAVTCHIVPWLGGHSPWISWDPSLVASNTARCRCTAAIWSANISTCSSNLPTRSFKKLFSTLAELPKFELATLQKSLSFSSKNVFLKQFIY